jgi:hypothetical protein
MFGSFLPRPWLVRATKVYKGVGTADIVMESLRSLTGSELLTLLPSRPIPQCEFDPIAYANLLVDISEIVPDNPFADPEFLGHFFVLVSSGYQLDDSQLASADEFDSGAIHKVPASPQFPILRVVPSKKLIAWLTHEGRSTSKRMR